MSHKTSALFRSIVLSILCGMLVCTATGQSATVTGRQITEFRVPRDPHYESFPFEIAAGPDRALWFTAPAYSDKFGLVGNEIDRIDLDGRVTIFHTPTLNSGPNGIAAGPDGALWFVETQQFAIGRVTVHGKFSEYEGADYPELIAQGPDRALWYTEANTKYQLCRITTGGLARCLYVPNSTYQNQLNDLSSGPDAAIWFTMVGNPGPMIGRFVPSESQGKTLPGTFTEFRLPAGAAPDGIVTGPDGALWFTDDTGKIGRITTDGQVTEFTVRSPDPGLSRLAAGPDGALWFTERKANNIGRITTKGVITEIPVPTQHAGVHGIAEGPDGAMWFTESRANKIGRLRLR